MSNQITNPPNEYDFGLSFNYAVWTPGTIVTLCNVRWDSNYRDVVRFQNRAALNSYLTTSANPRTEIRDMSYAKPNQPISVNLPINRVMGYNYLRASNPVQPVPGNDVQKDYYYFILDVQYQAPNTTLVTVQLDVMQTFGYDAKFGTCYVERGHIGIANSKQAQNQYRDYLTVPEGLDVGSDYQLVTKRTEQIMPIRDADDLNGNYDIIVVSTTDLRGAPGTKEDPNMDTGPGSTVQSIPSGATFYLFPSAGSFASWLNTMKTYPWITQGIISATIMPKISRYNPSFTYSGDYPQRLGAQAYPRLHYMFMNWRSSAEFNDHIPARYRHLKKLFTFPYMVIEMTTWSSTPVVLRPEVWQSEHARIMERINYLPPNQRVQFMPRGYNANGDKADAFTGQTDAEFEAFINTLIAQGLDPDLAYQLKSSWDEKGDDNGDYLDVMTQIANFPSIPVVNNGALSYLASNAHSIQHARSSASWAHTRAREGARTSFDVAQSAVNTMREVGGNNITADMLQTGNINRTQAAQAVVNAVSQGIQGAGQGGIVGGLRGGPAGAAAGAVAGGALSAGAGAINAGIQIAANDEALAIRNAQARGNLAAESGQMGYSARKNNDLALFAAKGDYQNTVAGINAQVQDAELVQPSMSGQFGGDMINLANNTAEVSLRWKMLDQANMRIICEYWLRYGYAVRTSLTPPADWKCMTKFTYWKFAESYIIGTNIPEVFKNTIRGIFEKGVTVYSNPDDIGTVDWGTNQPLPGISY